MVFVDFETSSWGGQVDRPCNPSTPCMIFSVRYAICEGPKLDTQKFISVTSANCQHDDTLCLDE